MSEINRRGLLGAAAALGGAAGVGVVAGATPAAATGGNGAECPPPVGPVTVDPDDPRYADLASRGINRRYQGRPDYFRLVGSTGQVVAAVREALRDGRRIAVRSGGHCFEDFVDNPDVGVVIDMSQMDDVAYDPDRDAFMVEPGGRLIDVFEKLYLGWGVTIPGGNCGGVGVGGHLCGGGYGPLSRKLGSVVDYLHAVEVVVADRGRGARAVIATDDPADPHHDLWWAHTGGGGGNFGVVTRYWLRVPSGAGGDPSRLLPRPPATMLQSAVPIPWRGLTKKAFTTLMRNHGTWFEHNSAPDSPYTGLWSVLMLNSSSGTGGDEDVSLLVTQMDATVPNARRLLDDYVHAVLDGVEPAPTVPEPARMSWLQSVYAINSGQEGGGAATKVKAGYLRKRFTDAQIETIHDRLTADAAGTGTVWLVAYGGRVNTVAPSATALPQRDSMLKALYITGWEDPRDEPAQLAWVRGLYRDVYAETGGVPAPSDNSDGAYINYPDNDLADPEHNTSGIAWHELYYKRNYPRLQRVKATYDPNDVFRHTLSVRPD